MTHDHDHDHDVTSPAGQGQVTAEEADVSFDERLADFYAPAVSLNRLRPRPGAATAPADLLLRALEPPPVKVRHIPLIDLLRRPYRELGDD
ncbi:hypothetical protein [Streptosporangium sp. NPDC000396]|uniref:hypothetical protein n=1 Tax=Streptosporangium sp. NPDC000396 TaxID=3366185 RepID=UPI0036C7445D